MAKGKTPKKAGKAKDAKAADPKSCQCKVCLYWDQRPEEGMAGNTGYCRLKESIVCKTVACDRFKKRTRKAQDRMYREIYGEIEDEDAEDGEE